MTNEQIYVCISIGCILFIGGWSLVIAVALDKARATIKEQTKIIARLVEPPF